jgi:hypothetical protein
MLGSCEREELEGLQLMKDVAAHDESVRRLLADNSNEPTEVNRNVPWQTPQLADDHI